MCVFQGHFSCAKLWRGSTINRRGHSGEGGLRKEEVCSEHLLVSKSRALAGLFRRPFSTRTVPHTQPLLQSIKTRARAKCSGLGHHDSAPAHHHPKSTKTVPGRRGSVLLWTYVQLRSISWTSCGISLSPVSDPSTKLSSTFPTSWNKTHPQPTGSRFITFDQAGPERG